MGGKGLIAVGAPREPGWLLYIKGAIIILSLIILAISAYALSELWYGGAPGMNVFVCILSWIVYGLSIGLSLGANQFFFRIGFFVAQILLIIFWLTSWAWSASYAAAYSSPGWYRARTGVMGACAGLGALTWILVIVDFVFFTMGCVRDEDKSEAAVTTMTPGHVELGHNKEAAHMEPGVAPGQAQQPQQYYPQQPQYAPQPGYPQQPTA